MQDRCGRPSNFNGAEAARRLLKIPTGNGMALVFYTSPEAPVQCAVEFSRALKDYPLLQVRMGTQSGLVSGVVDVNERANLAGAGLNIAQRVMYCVDAGHILLCKHSNGRQQMSGRPATDVQTAKGNIASAGGRRLLSIDSPCECQDTPRQGACDMTTFSVARGAASTLVDVMT